MLNYRPILLFLLFFLSLSYSGSGQNHPFYYTINKSNGLPSNTVYDIFQDKQGYMWFATELGICRFDGKVYETYTENSALSKTGSCIKEDALGRIWYSNFDGNLFYIEQNQLHAFNNKNTIGFVKFCLFEKNLIVIEKNGIMVYDIKTLKPMKRIPLSTQKLITAYSNANHLWILADQFYTLDPQLKLRSQKLPTHFLSDFPAAIMQERSNGLLLVSKYAKHFYTYENGTFTKHIIKEHLNFIQNIGFDHQSNWICTTQGVIKYTGNDIVSKNNYFKDFNISYVYKDRSGNYWFSTINEGLLLVPEIQNQFIPFSHKPNVITIDGTQLFVGTTDDHIFKFNLPNFQPHPFYEGKTNHEVYFLNYDPLLKKCFFTSNTFKSCSLNKTNEINEIIAIKDIDRVDNTLYSYAASGNCGLLRVSNTPSPMDKFIQKKGLNTEGKDNLLRILIANVQGKSTTFNPLNQTIYFATNKGLFAFKDLKKTALLWNSKPLLLKKIKTINGITYGLTGDSKLIKIDVNNRIAELSTSRLTHQEAIEKIKFIGSNIYLFTSQSIFEWNVNSSFSKKIFTLNPEFEVSDLDRFNSQYILATNHGFLLIHSQATTRGALPKFNLNYIQINDTAIAPSQLQTLQYNQNKLRFNYSILSFIPNQKNKLFYKLNDEPWQLLDEESRNFTLSALAPGKYTLQFKIVYDNQSSAPVQIQFEIEKPFWLTFWFYGFVLLIILGLFYWGFQWQLKKIKKRNQLLIDKINLEKNVNQSKLKAIKSQMNPHFFYNALNTIQSFILANEKKQAVNYLSKFSSLTRMILEMSDKEVISIAEEIKALSLYLEIEKARFEEDFSYQIQTDSSLDTETLKIPTLLIQPYVENAIKHGLLHKSGPKILHLDFALVDHQIVITIDDNGVGRQKSSELNQIKNRKHKSFATEALQNRISLWNLYHNQPIQLEISDKISANGIALGTFVQLKIPYSS
ncbi:sensor histidine kinase [Flavobacterium stagni]|uniref:Signal transduction histidine kinase internal region domain-containing protein n=1 Tax=Flavobacterium stagni TaxID=2506421 RepID=A0A4Q1K9J1_9FLAO|nr:histidine kinase [Flavobacterium stagni]RXR22210.1 hypothetical protein EQG61_09435 [Flavobacterium stagni]